MRNLQPLPEKFKVGDIVIAIDEYYNVTNKKFNFTGIVISNEIFMDIQQTHCTHPEYSGQQTKIWKNLHPSHFQLSKSSLFNSLYEKLSS